MEASFSRPLSQSECRDNKNAATFWKGRVLIQWEYRISRHNKYHMQQNQRECRISRQAATEPMSMLYFQTQQKPRVTEVRHSADKHFLFHVKQRRVDDVSKNLLKHFLSGQDRYFLRAYEFILSFAVR